MKIDTIKNGVDCPQKAYKKPPKGYPTVKIIFCDKCLFKHM